MGITSSLRTAAGQLSGWHDTNRHNASLFPWEIRAGRVIKNAVRPSKRADYAAADCTAEIIGGTSHTSTGAGGALGGALLAGTTGAIIGQNLRSEHGKGWVILRHPGGSDRIAFHPEELAKAQKFVMNLTLEAERQLAAH